MSKLHSFRLAALLAAVLLSTASLGASESLNGPLYCPWVTCWITCEPGNPNAPGYVTHVGSAYECCTYSDGLGCYSAGIYACDYGQITDCWSQPQ